MQNREHYDVIVIGAGAAGLMAAGTAAESGAKVLVLESMPRPGRKLLITGKGRCNITNNSSISEYLQQIHPLPKFCQPMFSRFFVKDSIDFFRHLGLETVEERGRRVFPQSQRSMDVLNALLERNRKLGVHVLYSEAAKKILTDAAEIKGVHGSSGNTYHSTALILASGGKSYPATGSRGDGYRLAQECGHHVSKLFPALVPLECSGLLAPALQGISLKNVEAGLYIKGKRKSKRFGEMLFTHYGLSGPVILDMSREAVQALEQQQKVAIHLDCKPALDAGTLDARLIRELQQHAKAKLKTMLKTLLPLHMIIPFCREISLDAEKLCSRINAEERRLIRDSLKNLRFELSGFRGWDEAIVTAGGIELKELNPSSMESKIVKRLFFAGEILNLDAATGGYNLQIAWSSGFVAGKSAARAALS